MHYVERQKPDSKGRILWFHLYEKGKILRSKYNVVTFGSWGEGKMN